MKKISPSAFLRGRFPPAIAAGLLLAAAFPKTGAAGFAWIAPGLILATALGTRGKESFRIGYLAGLAHYLASLYWLLHIPYRWHGIPIGPALGWLALSAFLALFPATWVWLAMRVSGARCQVSGEGKRTWLEAATEISARPWSRRVLWALCCAATWVALEMIIARIFGGFPWNLLAASQYRIVPLLQIASFTGVYGVSFLIAWTSVSLLCALLVILRRPSMRSIWMGEIILPLAAVMGAFVFGFHQLNHPPATDRELKIALVQPSIPQTLIWDPDNDRARFENLIKLSEQALVNPTDVLIWPEAAVPSYVRWDTNIYPAIARLAREHHVWIILGSDDVEPIEHPVGEEKYHHYNASFLMNPNGELAPGYRKRNLVIFGEYIPLVRWLPFIKFLTPWMPGSFTPGDKAVPFEMNVERRSPTRHEGSVAQPAGSETGAPETLRVKTSVLICFEDNFPHLVRDYVEDDTDFLVNITNNGWFGESAAQWQHAANAVFRAVENGLPLVRCTNNGLTCWVDANGRLRKIFRDQNRGVYGRGFSAVQLPLLAAGEKRAPTFYNRHGDRFGWGCVVVAMISVGWSLLRRSIRK